MSRGSIRSPRLADGGDCGTCSRFDLNHPDGRTTDSLEIVAGPGLRARRREFAKQSGNWGLKVDARGGRVFFGEALHDRAVFSRLDDKRMLSVEGMR